MIVSFKPFEIFETTLLPLKKVIYDEYKKKFYAETKY